MKLTLSSVYEVTRIQVCQPLLLALALFVTTPVALRAQLPQPGGLPDLRRGHRHSGQGLVRQQP